MGVTEENKKKFNTRRRRNKARKFWRVFKFLLLAVFFVVLVIGLNFFYGSNYFKIKNIGIEGNKHYDKEDIVQNLNFIVGSNIFEINKKSINDSLIDNFPWIKDAEVSKVFPDEITVYIFERSPYIKISHLNDHYLLDNEGIVLEKIKKEDVEGYEDILLVNNAINYIPDNGDRIAKKSILSCGEIYLSLDNEIKSQIREARIKDNEFGDIYFITIDGKEILYGNSSNIIEKNKTLKQIIRLFLQEEQNYNIIDIRDYDSPIIK